jgi:hypothetical protein
MLFIVTAVTRHIQMQVRNFGTQVLQSVYHSGNVFVAVENTDIQQTMRIFAVFFCM